MEWEAAYCSTHNRYYYFNRRLNVTQWEPPSSTPSPVPRTLFPPAFCSYTPAFPWPANGNLGASQQKQGPDPSSATPEPQQGWFYYDPFGRLQLRLLAAACLIPRIECLHYIPASFSLPNTFTYNDKSTRRGLLLGALLLRLCSLRRELCRPHIYAMFKYQEQVRREGGGEGCTCHSAHVALWAGLEYCSFCLAGAQGTNEVKRDICYVALVRAKVRCGQGTLLPMQLVIWVVPPLHLLGFRPSKRFGKRFGSVNCITTVSGRDGGRSTNRCHRQTLPGHTLLT
eukprot:1152556-Pelagomonas_calceolata.AAC.1